MSRFVLAALAFSITSSFAVSTASAQTSCGPGGCRPAPPANGLNAGYDSRAGYGSSVGTGRPYRGVGYGPADRIGYAPAGNVICGPNGCFVNDNAGYGPGCADGQCTTGYCPGGRCGTPAGYGLRVDDPRVGGDRFPERGYGDLVNRRPVSRGVQTHTVRQRGPVGIVSGGRQRDRFAAPPRIAAPSRFDRDRIGSNGNQGGPYDSQPAGATSPAGQYF